MPRYFLSFKRAVAEMDDFLHWRIWGVRRPEHDPARCFEDLHIPLERQDG